MPGAEQRLAVYGTLAPGRPNHHQLDGLSGHWRNGTVTGHLVAAGWGSALGYPGLIPDVAGETVAVQLFESEGLSAHWPRLDAFEGDGYRRVVIDVRTEDGDLDACIYVIA